MGNRNADALLVDVGNSRIKYAWVASTGNLTVLATDELSVLHQAMSDASQVILASVKDAHYNQELLDFCQQRGIQAKLVETSAECFGIHCAYQYFQNLGVDRWLAVLGARSLTDKVVAVIDLGSAATCDVVVGNQHKGGWIAPGFSMMRHALVSGTSRVFSDLSRPTRLTLGEDTPECVNLGCLAMLNGFIEQAKSSLSEYGEDYCIYICGGDIDLIDQHSDRRVIVEKDLLFLGLKRFLSA